MALKGIKVVEFGGLAPAPFCGKILKDLGAKVIRIDKTGAIVDQDRLSHGKKSIALNLKKKQSIEIVKKLTNDADVLIDPFRKGVMERLGLGPSEIFSFNPRLVYARLSGYGQTGELSNMAGHDINYISYSGVLSRFGRENQKPHAPVNIVADFAGGGLMCAFAIMSSLYERATKNTTHKVIDCAMVEGSAYICSWLWTSRDIPGLWENHEIKGKNTLDGGYHAYDSYETADGHYIAVGSLEPQFYKNLLKGLGLENSDEEITKEKLENEFRKKTRKQWTDIFEKLDACVSPILSLDEAPFHKHNKDRNSFIQLESKSFLPTMNWIKDHSKQDFRIPKIGEHTFQILNELGYSDKQIHDLKNENIVEQSGSSSIKSKL